MSNIGEATQHLVLEGLLALPEKFRIDTINITYTDFEKVWKEINNAKKHPDWYTPEEVSQADDEKQSKENRRHKMFNISEATQHDCMTFGTSKVWNMKIVITLIVKEWINRTTLTPITQSSRKINHR